jgi:CRP/FNR family transcriptional regulator
MREIFMSCPCNKNDSGCREWSSVCIGELWLFEGLARSELEAVAARAKRAKYASGEAVFTQGDQAESIFLIKSGRIRISRTMDSGTEVILDIRKPGDYLGEYILNDLESEYHYPVSAWCMEDVTTCGFTRSVFEELVLKHPPIGLKVIRNMAGRIARLTERLDAMSQTHLEEKLYGVLLNVAREHGTKRKDGCYVLEMPLTHEDIGFLIGAHRVSVTRIMKRLKETGRISQNGRFLVIIGDESLRSVQH